MLISFQQLVQNAPNANIYLLVGVFFSLFFFYASVETIDDIRKYYK